MSAYTTLHIVPIDSPEWIPDWGFIKDVLLHLGVTSTWSASGYSVPNYWEDEETDLHDNALFFKSDWRVDLDTAFDLWRERKPVYTSMSFFARGYVDMIIDSLLSIPEPVRGTTTLDTVSLGIGPFSIPSIQWETVIGRFRFEFGLHGGGMPWEYDQYVQAVRDNLEIKKLLAWLREKSGRQWDVLISCSY